MLVRMNTRYASPRGVCNPGGTIDLSDVEAAQLIAGGYAVAAVPSPKAPTPEPEPDVEEAIVEPPEKAVRRRGRSRKVSGG